jgi:exonuclease III
MRIATFNINGVRNRVKILTSWLAQTEPDIVCLQELKCETSQFPREAVESAGYGALVHGRRHGTASPFWRVERSRWKSAAACLTIRIQRKAAILKRPPTGC